MEPDYGSEPRMIIKFMAIQAHFIAYPQPRDMTVFTGRYFAMHWA